ncbi:DUF6276 family protein [Halorussus litoreus]|uniref:DUF6276 family protein n=1 Tax=Halorussus litoreus TaxID=1710536 RepID=UPI000E289CDD|nr:DUF6276 family protein [Halorussus litoreus]
MTCPDCGGDQLAFRVPADLRDHLPEASAAVAICTRCLAIDPVEESDVPEGPPDFSAISDAFPSGDAGVAMALAVGLLDSLALYRAELSALLERVERAGSDPLLVLDRLAANSGVDPHFDVDRRRTQAEQLLYG